MTVAASHDPRRRRPWAWWILPLAALGLVMAMGWGAYEVYQDREKRYRHQVESALRVANMLQAQSVADWRQRRLAEGAALLDDSLFAQAVARWQATPAPEREALVRERLRTMVERAKYTAAYLVSPDGQLLLSPAGPANGQLPQPARRVLQRALDQAEPAMVEMHRNALFAFPIFGVLAPVFDGVRPVAAVWLVSDVRTTLYPLLDAWPSASRTAESVLVERDGDEVLYLSPLRHRFDEPLTLREPLAGADNDDPVQRAALGARGTLYGRDYRNERVLAMVSTVPDSPWLLISKMDVADAFTDAQRREWLALALLASLGLLWAGSMAVLWQWRAWRRERALKTELERNMRWLENAQQAASVGYFAYDAARAEFFMSRMASAMFGLPADGYMTLRQWVAMLHPEERERVLDIHGRALSGRAPLRTQYRILRPSDGQVRWIEVWGEYGSDDEAGPARMTGTVQDITERKHAEEQLARYRAALEERVRLDALTQVANRLALDEVVAQEWSRAERDGSSLALLMIDVDHFKAYNDRYGHVAGDQCLQSVARALSSGAVLRASDLVARYGGEEFAVLLPGTDATFAAQAAQRLCEAVNALALEHSANPQGDRVTISVGVASLRPRDVAAPPGQPRAGVDAAQALFQQADAALYRAKQAGRNQVAIYEPGRMDVLHAPAPVPQDLHDL